MSGCRFKGGAAGWHERRGVPEAPGGLIGSPSVSGTEQMSELKDRSLFAFYFTFSPFVCVVDVTAVVYECVYFACMCVFVHVLASDISHSG